MQFSRLDQRLAERLRSRAGTKGPWSFFARYAMYFYVLEAAVLAFVLPWSSWITLALSAVGCYAAVLLVQVIVRRKRPQPLPHGFKLWVHTYSFPSAHASSSFACSVLASTAALAFAPSMAPVVIALNFLIACGIALSRVVVGVHYPSDVAVGACFGTLLSLWLVLLT